MPAMKEDTMELTIPSAGSSGECLVARFKDPASGPGSAPMVLYLHGFGSDQWGEKASFFRKKALEDGLGFCSFDFQGHGRSGGRMIDLTLSRQLSDVEIVGQMLADRGYGQTIVLGSSMGGLTALWYSALHPERVSCGLCIAPALSLESSLEDWAGEEGMKSWREKGSIHVDNEIGSWDLGWGFVSDLETFPVSRLKRLCRRPFLILQGKLDDRVEWRQVLDFVDGCELDELELHLFANGDHRLVDRKERLWRLMRDFLEFRGNLP